MFTLFTTGVSNWHVQIADLGPSRHTITYKIILGPRRNIGDNTISYTSTRDLNHLGVSEIQSKAFNPSLAHTYSAWISCSCLAIFSLASKVSATRHETIARRDHRVLSFGLICNTISRAGRPQAMWVYAILGEGLILTISVSQTSFRKWAGSVPIHDYTALNKKLKRNRLTTSGPYAETSSEILKKYSVSVRISRWT